MEHYRWTYRHLDTLILGHGLPAVCDDEWHEKCINDSRGCYSILDQGLVNYKGNTSREREENRRKIAKEAQRKCRRIKVTIEKAKAILRKAEGEKQ